MSCIFHLNKRIQPRAATNLLDAPSTTHLVLDKRHFLGGNKSVAVWRVESLEPCEIAEPVARAIIWLNHQIDGYITESTRFRVNKTTIVRVPILDTIHHYEKSKSNQRLSCGGGLFRRRTHNSKSIRDSWLQELRSILYTITIHNKGHRDVVHVH